MGFKNNGDGTKTWTNSSGTYSYTRDKNGKLMSTTSSTSSGFSKTTTYSNGRSTGVTRTYPNGTIKKGR